MQLKDKSSIKQNESWLTSSILVIDDQPDSGGMIINALDHKRMKLATADTHRQALMKATKHHMPFDAIFIHAKASIANLQEFIQQLKSANVYRQPAIAVYDEQQPDPSQFPHADICFNHSSNITELKQQLEVLWSARKAAQKQNTEQVFSTKPSVLLVEDDDINLKVVKMMLRNLKCTVETATTGTQALELTQDQCFDVILMDIGLPDLNGYDATKTIRSNTDNCNHTTPIIAITAFISDRELNRCFDEGMDDIITKPVNLNDLQESIAANYQHKQDS